MFEKEIFVAPLLETRIDVIAKRFTDSLCDLVPVNCILFEAVIRGQIEASAKPPDRFVGFLFRKQEAHIEVSRWNIGVERMNDQGYAGGEERSAVEFRPPLGRRGWQLVALYQGKVDSGLFENTSVRYHAAFATPALGVIPAVAPKLGGAVKLLKDRGEPVLQINEVTADRFDFWLC